MTIDINKLRRLALAATPGPWDFSDSAEAVSCAQRYVGGFIPIANVELGWNEPLDSEQRANGEFIAAANPVTVIELLDEIERLRTQRDEHKADWLEALALAEQASPILARQQAEIERLRAVFEAVRAVLRYGGPDKFGKAWCELDKAVKAALLADQGGYLV